MSRTVGAPAATTRTAATNARLAQIGSAPTSASEPPGPSAARVGFGETVLLPWPVSTATPEGRRLVTGLLNHRGVDLEDDATFVMLCGRP
jgi:hypothetical protein